MTKEVILTPEGYEKFEKELKHLKTVKRREIAQRIKQARSFGDISENSEYDDAKNEQAFIEGRIKDLENMLRHAKIINDEEIETNSVSVGTRVKLLDVENDEELEYVIVGSAESDPLDHKISNESPVGQAIIGHQVGDVVEVAVPDGVIEYKILEIEKA